MRVNNTTTSPVQSGQSNEASSAKRSGRAKEAGTEDVKDAKEHRKSAPVDGAKAEISTRGREVAAAKTAATNAPDVRTDKEEKIAELKRRIADSRYKVDADAVADKLVDEHLNMSGLG